MGIPGDEYETTVERALYELHAAVEDMVRVIRNHRVSYCGISQGHLDKAAEHINSLRNRRLGRKDGDDAPHT